MQTACKTTPSRGNVSPAAVPHETAEGPSNGLQWESHWPAVPCSNLVITIKDDFFTTQAGHWQSQDKRSL